MNDLSVLFISGYCNAQKDEWILSLRNSPGLDPSQRLFKAVIEGLRYHGCDVTCISALPIGTSNSSRELRYFKRSEETVDEIKFIYPAFRIGRIKRLWDLYKNTKQEVKRWLQDTEGKKRVVICDSLLVMCTGISRKISQKHKVKVFAYVTDYPSMATNIKRRKVSFTKRILQYLFDKYADKDLKKYDGYILVAEGLKDLIKIKKQPYLIIEDIISIPKDILLKKEVDNDKFIIVYGGALCERFGINKLIDAISLIHNNKVRLYFYGSGESTNYINTISKRDARIKYCGLVSFDELQKIQRNASLLINPRPSDEIFAAYSFPSKTLSYMLTGTPVLSTKISGIPASYQPYLYWFDKEDVISMAKKIEEIMEIPPAELKAKGHKALEYVINEKNEVIQSFKLIKLIEGVING